MCVELNAHALITYVLTIRDCFHGDFDKFLPWMLGSQTCERTFRIIRSMSSVYSTPELQYTGIAQTTTSNKYFTS